MRPKSETPVVLISIIFAVTVIILFVISLGAVLVVSNTGDEQAAAGREPGEIQSSASVIALDAPATIQSTTAALTTEVQSSVPTDMPPATSVAEVRTTTATPLPTATLAASVPMATPAPTSIATTRASTTFMEDTFDTPVSGWPVRDEATWSASYAGGQYQLTLDGQPTVGVSTSLRETDYRLGVDVIPSQQGDAGLIFLFSEPATFYQIALRPNGTYAIQQVDHETVTNVVEWSSSAALRRGEGVTNRLSIERQGDTVRFFANDQLLTGFAPPEGQFTNRFGFTLTSSTEQGQASFDNLVGEALSNSQNVGIPPDE